MSEGTGSQLERADVASMRPEHGCSGNEGIRRPMFGNTIRFNEAGARMLRK